MAKRNQKNNEKKTKKANSNKLYKKPEIQEVEFTVKADPSPAYAPY